MDARVQKLAHTLRVDRAVAEALVKHGFDTPKKIKSATSKELQEVPGIGPATVKQIRRRWQR